MCEIWLWFAPDKRINEMRIYYWQRVRKATMIPIHLHTFNRNTFPAFISLFVFAVFSIRLQQTFIRFFDTYAQCTLLSQRCLLYADFFLFVHNGSFALDAYCSHNISIDCCVLNVISARFGADSIHLSEFLLPMSVFAKVIIETLHL